MFGTCGHCGMMHSGPCPRIKAIEYHSNGMVKRVEYWPDQSTVAQPMVVTRILVPQSNATDT